MGQGGEAKAAGEEVEQVGRGQTKKGLLFFGFLSKGMESHGGLSDLRVWVFFLLLLSVSALESRLEMATLEAGRAV